MLVLVGMIVGVSVSMFVSMLMSFGRIRLHPYRLLCSICGLLSGLGKGRLGGICLIGNLLPAEIAGKGLILREVLRLRLYASQRLAQGYLE